MRLRLNRKKLLRARELLGYGIEKVAEEAGISKNSVLRAEHEEDIRPVTARKIAAALSLSVADLIGESETLKAQPPLLAVPEERRADWESAVENARRLREDGLGRMAELLSTWRASKEREEAYAVRRGHLDAMGRLLQQAYDAVTALVEALSGAHLAQQWPELQKADRFYVDLWRLVQDAGLSIRTGDEEEAAEHEATVESSQPEARPVAVE